MYSSTGTQPAMPEKVKCSSGWISMVYGTAPTQLTMLLGSLSYVFIVVSNAGWIMFKGTVQKYWLPTPVACFPFTSPPVRHRVPSRFKRALQPSS